MYLAPLTCTSIAKSPYFNHIFHQITMSNRVIPVVGLAAAGGVGYYLYNAGGDPKLAEKKFERT